jgi:DNA-binding MarR family transcriptional regulator
MLADSESPLPPNEIADRLIISRATVTGLLDSLERRAYIRRQPHPSDRRMILAEITETGRKIADEFRPIVHQHQKEWFEVLGETEQQQFLVALHRLQESLQKSD